MSKKDSQQFFVANFFSNFRFSGILRFKKKVQIEVEENGRLMTSSKKVNKGGKRYRDTILLQKCSNKKLLLLGRIAFCSNSLHYPNLT